MPVDVGKVKRFLVGLYGEGLLKEAQPDLTVRQFYVGRDLRAVVPLKHKLAGYHARWFAWFSPGPSSVDVDFPPRIHFTRPGGRDTRFELELERVGGVDGVIEWVARNNLALQVSLSYTSVKKGRLGRVYSGDVHALYLLMLEFEDKRGGNNLEPVKKVVNEVVDRAATFVEEPFIVFSGNKSYYLIFALPTPVKAGSATVRDRFGRIVREYSLSEVYRALFNLVLRDKAYLGLGSEVITRFVDAQVAEPKRLLRVPGFKHEKSGRETTQLDVDLRPTDFNPDALAKSMLPKSVLTDYWAFIDLPKPEKTSSSGVTTYATQNNNDNKTRGCLPNWVKTLIDYLRETGELCHYGRLAIASWMIRCGFSDEEIHEVFKHASDYNPRTTQYHINYTREKYLGEKGGRPVRCETVVENCKGHNVPSIDCKSLPNPPTKPEAPTADPKPKEKPESKAETKSEVKPADAKPRQVRHRENVQIPDALIEGVARELRESVTVVRELVKCVVNYLDSLPCCQAIHTEQVLDGLLASANEDIIFTLYALGIDYKAVWTDPGYFSALWDAYITILKYLDQAGIVEVRDDGATIVITKGGMCRCEDTENQVEVARHT